jgi:hypothetical protein
VGRRCYNNFTEITWVLFLADGFIKHLYDWWWLSTYSTSSNWNNNTSEELLEGGARSRLTSLRVQPACFLTTQSAACLRPEACLSWVYPRYGVSLSWYTAIIFVGSGRPHCWSACICRSRVTGLPSGPCWTIQNWPGGHWSVTFRCWGRCDWFYVADLRGPPCGRSQTTPMSAGVPDNRSQGRRSSLRNSLWSHGLMLCRSAGRWVVCHSNLCGVSKRPSFGALQPSSYIYSTVTCDCGWRGTVHLLPVPRLCSTSCRNGDSKIRPWSPCASGTAYLQKNTVTAASATWQSCPWQSGCIAALLRFEKFLQCLGQNCRTGASGPSSWFGGLDLVCGCYSVGRTSLPGCSTVQVVPLCDSEPVFTPGCSLGSTQWTSASSSFTLLRGRTLSHLGSSVGRLPLALQHAVPHDWGLPLGYQLL